MSRCYIISDHHFGHKKILEFEKVRGAFDSIDDHDDWLVAQHNNIVTKRDTVWFLGDVALNTGALERCLPRMLGTKHLIIGNHDTYKMELYQRYFVKIQAMKSIHGWLLTHIPVHSSQLQRFKGNVHGHTHSTLVGEGYVNVCVEKCNGVPRTFEHWVAT